MGVSEDDVISQMKMDLGDRLEKGFEEGGTDHPDEDRKIWEGIYESPDTREKAADGGYALPSDIENVSKSVSGRWRITYEP